MRIQNKLFITWLFSSALLIAAMVLIMQWSVDRGMLEYINTREANSLQPAITSLGEVYQQDKNWNRFVNNPHQFNRFLHEIRRSQSEFSNRDFNRFRRDLNRRPPSRRQRPPIGGYTLFDADKSLITGNPEIRKQILIPIDVEGKTVAWLGMRKHEEITEIFELQFLENTRDILLITGLIMIVLSVIFTLPLARHFVSPIQKIVAVVHKLTQGNFDSKLEVNRSDEFSTLANDINQLSNTLKENDSTRKRWLADTSHELRTPLAILRGEIEAMVDGVRPMDQKQLSSLHQESIHLSKLIDDLYELSSADVGGLSYQKQPLDLAQLLHQQLDHHKSITELKEITLSLMSPDNVLINADPKRFSQLIDNLIDNACKYTDAGGRIELSVAEDNNTVILTIEDSAPGVPDDSLTKLFDHLYRVDDSRNRSSGGSGLGLAIVQRIVIAHQGTIAAEHSPLGGVRIVMRFPTA